MKNNYYAKEIDGFILQTLMYGLDDWVQSSELVSHIFFLEPIFKKNVSSELLKIIDKCKHKGLRNGFVIAQKLSIAIINEVLDEGLMTIGDLYDGFVPWPISNKEAILTVKSKWAMLKSELPVAGEYWLSNTLKGDKIGQDALLQWRQSRDL